MLKACPFCGNDKIEGYCRSGKFGHFMTIRCKVCGAQSGAISVKVCEGGCSQDFCKFADEAYDVAKMKWNQRA